MNSRLYQEHYREEWQRRTEIESTYNLPVTVFTVLGGAIFLLARGHRFNSEPVSLAFFGLIAAAALFYVMAVANLVRSMYGYTYERIPTSKQLGDHYDALVRFHVNAGRTERDAHKDFESYVNARYAQATDVNTWNNVSKSEFLHQSNRWLIAAFAAVGLASLPALYHAQAQAEEAQLVQLSGPIIVQEQVSEVATSPEGRSPPPQPPQPAAATVLEPPQSPAIISEPSEVVMSPEEKNPQPPPATEQPSQAPPKPEGPPNIKVREGKQPEKPEGPRNIEVFEPQTPKGRPR